MAEPTFAAKMDVPGNLLNAQLGVRIGAAGLGAAGIFAALRGLRGLSDTYAGAHSPPPTMPTRRQFVTVPIAASRDREREKVADGPLVELARELVQIKQAAPTFMENAAGHALDFAGLLKKPGVPLGPVQDALANPSAQSLQQKPWAMALAPFALAAGGYAGYKLTDKALDWSRHRETDSELDAAKQQYEHALLPKRAGAPHALDTAFDALTAAQRPADAAAGHALAESLLADREKVALAGILNPALAAYLFAGTALAGTAGVGAYNWSKAHSEGKSVTDALRQRRERMFATSPAPIFAVPEERDAELDPPTPARLSPAMLRAALPKAAALGDVASGVLGKFDQQQRSMAMRTALMLGAKPPKPAPAAKADNAAPPLPSVVSPVPAASGPGPT